MNSCFEILANVRIYTSYVFWQNDSPAPAAAAPNAQGTMSSSGERTSTFSGKAPL